SAVLTLSHSIVADNLALGSVGSAGHVGGRGWGGGIFNGSSTSVLNVAYATVTGNEARAGDGGGGGNGNTGRGGGIGVGGGTVSLEFVRITDNRGAGGAAGEGGKAGEGMGGGIYVAESAYVCARYTEVVGNLASTDYDDVFGEIDWC